MGSLLVWSPSWLKVKDELREKVGRVSLLGEVLRIS